MKIRFLFISILCCVSISAHSQWQWINPLPQGNSILNLHFLNENTGYVVGNHGTIMKTTDGGETWIIQDSKTELNLTSVSFADTETGFIAGGNWYSDDSLAIILKTGNSGNDWNIVYQNDIGALRSVFCVTQDTVFAAGKNGALLRSVNGGNDWQVLDSGIDDVFVQVIFPKSLTGYAIARNGQMIKSENGGLSWQELELGTPPNVWLISVSFPSPDTGFVLVYEYELGPGHVLKTEDGGATWTKVLQNTVSPSAMDFISADTGYVAASGIDYFTTDGGQSWESIYNGAWYDCQVNLISSDLVYYTVGSESVSFLCPHIFKSENGGSDWIKLTSSFSDDALKDIAFPEESTGYACDYNYINPFILKTMDAQKWDTVLFLNDTILTASQILDESTILIGGYYYNYSTNEEYGIFGASFDGGTSWSMQDLGISNNPVTISFYNTSTGFIGTHQHVYKTVNSGSDWQIVYSDSLSGIRKVYFYSGSSGFILKNNYSSTIVMKSIDEGQNWEQIAEFEGQYPVSMQFPDEYHGFILTKGNGSSYLHSSTDGGLTWTEHFIEGISLNNFYFINDTLGYLVGEDGFIIKTTDGGNSWDINNDMTGNTLYDVFFIDEFHGYISGLVGTILYTETGGQVSLDETKVNPPNPKFALWPNPFSSITNISYTLKTESDVRIDIFNVNGRKVQTWLYKNQSGGKYETPLYIPDLSPGVYLIRFSSNRFIQTKKIIIM